MADYNVTIEDDFYDVRADEGLINYNLGVDYEIPTKSNQYSNLIFDSISGSFNGVNQLFPLTVNGEPYFPINEQLIIELYSR